MRCIRGKSVGGGLIKIFMKIQLIHSYNDIISLENLLEAWAEFVRGKRSRPDVQEFAQNLMGNLTVLHSDLVNQTYRHSHYTAFSISDPKPRKIHKATVRDRVLHHAIYRKLYPFFDRTFIADSFSCQLNKGTHKAALRFGQLAGKVSRNSTRTCWVLKCDIRKFFDSIDHGVLLRVLASYIPDLGVMLLLEGIIDSFSVSHGKGLPLGNLTSQIFCNVHMNELDQFIKHQLRIKNYIRYADDFAFLSEDKEWLVDIIPKISEFLGNNLKLTLHPDKVFIKTFASGVDFLGWVNFPSHRVLRTASKKRMIRRISQSPSQETVQSYLGLLSHGNAYVLEQEVLNQYELFKDK